VLFPDPWPKKRHVRRRLVDTSSIRRITDLLTVGGTLHLATDWPPYAHQMREVIGAEARLEPQVDAVDDGEGADGRPLWRSERPPRPVTAYEQRGLDAGRPITDLVVRRSS
jgi:tRNA (guanine-N7-)-methyltransferase